MPVSRPPRIAVPGRFFGAPWWPPPAACSVALNCGLASTERGTVTARSALTGTQFVCFYHWLSGQKLFAGLSLFTCAFQSLRRARRAHRDRRRLEPLGHGNAPREPPQEVGRAVCLSHSPSEIWPNTHFVFLPQLAAPGKESAKPPPPDYPSDEPTSSESSDSDPEEAPAENLSTGWSERVTRVDTQFHGDHVGYQNIPDHINHESTALSFLELFLDADFWGLLCRQTNLRAEQVKQSKPASYYAKNFKPVAVPELKAFLRLRLQMEKCLIKPRYESYWQGAGHNFIAHTPGFREVMERDRFIALWGCLHLVDQTDEAVDKSDKTYKVRPMLDRMLPLFHRYYSPASPSSSTYATSRSDGASRASCCARPRRATFSTQKSTWAGSGTATGPSSDQPAVLSAVSWRTCRSPTRTTCCSWTAFTTPSRSSTC